MLNVISGIFNISDLRKKFLYTLGMVVLFRLGGFIPVAGINTAKLQSLFGQGNILGFFLFCWREVTQHRHDRIGGKKI